MDLDARKDDVCRRIDELGESLTALADDLHEHPELCFEEHHAHQAIVAVVRAAGLELDDEPAGMPTAFVADAGSSGPRVSICCEYDALPEIGHACGHNLIAAAGVGAGLALAAVADELGGRVRIVGTPAEEGGGGKVRLLDAGVFADSDVAMMIHPAGRDLRQMRVIAVQQLLVDYRGRAAHAAAAPEKGRNALDAAVLGYVNVAALRQHIAEPDRIHGIFTRAGDKPNIVPEHAQAIWYVRSATLDGLADLEARVVRCLEAGAAAAGCELEISHPAPVYASFLTNPPLEQLFADNASRLGRDLAALDDPAVPQVSGSTDMGNVSQVVPSIHPMLAVSSPDVAIHTTEFARCTRGPRAAAAVLDGAKAMAMTALDVWGDETARAAITAAHRGAVGP